MVSGMNIFSALAAAVHFSPSRFLNSEYHHENASGLSFSQAQKLSRLNPPLLNAAIMTAIHSGGVVLFCRCRLLLVPSRLAIHFSLPVGKVVWIQLLNLEEFKLVPKTSTAKTAGLTQRSNPYKFILYRIALLGPSKNSKKLLTIIYV